MTSCTSCPSVRAEEWPRDVTALRCFDPGAPTGSITHYGRVVELTRFAWVGRIEAPAWCPRRGNPPPPSAELPLGKGAN